ncbi:conserved hypothetical protein [Virus Rctr71]|nr:conserved hypothetical protein [Virus Rctr71]
MTKRPLVAHADVGYAPKPAEVGILAIGDTHNPTSYTVTGKHYSYEYKGLCIDPYRIFRIYKITDPCLQHAIKKLLRAGRGSKPLLQDINEVISTLERMKDMMKEDGDA